MSTSSDYNHYEDVSSAVIGSFQRLKQKFGEKSIAALLQAKDLNAYIEKFIAAVKNMKTLGRIVKLPSEAPNTPLMTTSLFALVLLGAVILASRRTWSSRRSTRIYYGDGTSELLYEIASSNASYKKADSNDACTEDSSGKATRIKKLRKLVSSIEARKFIIESGAVFLPILFLAELIGIKDGVLRLSSITYLLSGIMHAEFGLMAANAKVMSMTLGLQWISAISLISSIMRAHMEYTAII